MADFTRLFDLFDYQNVSHPREDALNYKYGGFGRITVRRIVLIFGIRSVVLY